MFKPEADGTGLSSEVRGELQVRVRSG
jgi:hypothetical protein